MRNSLTFKFSPGDKYIQTLFHLGQLISLSLLPRKPEELWQHESLRLQEVHEEKKDKCTWLKYLIIHAKQQKHPQGDAGLTSN